MHLLLHDYNYESVELWIILGDVANKVTKNVAYM